MVSYAVTCCALFVFIKLALRDGSAVGGGVDDDVGGHISNF